MMRKDLKEIADVGRKVKIMKKASELCRIDERVKGMRLYKLPEWYPFLFIGIGVGVVFLLFRSLEWFEMVVIFIYFFLNAMFIDDIISALVKPELELSSHVDRLSKMPFRYHLNFSEWDADIKKLKFPNLCVICGNSVLKTHFLTLKGHQELPTAPSEKRAWFSFKYHVPLCYSCLDNLEGPFTHRLKVAKIISVVSFPVFLSPFILTILFNYRHAFWVGVIFTIVNIITAETSKSDAKIETVAINFHNTLEGNISEIGFTNEFYAQAFEKLNGSLVKRIVLRETVDVGGVIFPITSDVGKFCKIAVTTGACVLIINTGDYPDIRERLTNYFSERFGPNANFTKAVAKAKLLCANCKMQFPSSFRVKLINPNMDVSDTGFISPNVFKRGILSKIRQALGVGRNAKCPKCGIGKRSYFVYEVYENLSPSEITKEDIEALRKYWRHRAKEWWEARSKKEAVCDICSTPISKGHGFIDGPPDELDSCLLCESCCNKRLDFETVKKKLRENPGYFHKGELKRARAFRADEE